MVQSKQSQPKKTKKQRKYYEGVGRRKSVIARVRLLVSKSMTRKPYQILVNEKSFHTYFPLETLQKVVEEPFKRLKLQEGFEVTAKIHGGGARGQAEALRLGIARALRLYNPDFHPELHAHGLLTRDPRMKERKKPGLRGARKGQQWSKR